MTGCGPVSGWLYEKNRYAMTAKKDISGECFGKTETGLVIINLPIIRIDVDEH